MKLNKKERNDLSEYRELIGVDDTAPAGRKTRSDKGLKRKSYIPKKPNRYRSKVASCNRNGIAFNMLPDDYSSLLSMSCKFCSSTVSIQIERIDTSMPYTIENTYPICAECRSMMGGLSPDGFLRHIRKIHNHCCLR